MLTHRIATAAPRRLLVADEVALGKTIETALLLRELARRQGNTGRAPGFLMAIFQKIAASSFAAVRRTLERRLLMLTLHEALLRDRELDVQGRARLMTEARELVHRTLGLAHDRAGMNECERVLADLKYRLVKRLDEEALELASDPYGSEFATVHAEEAAAAVVNLHLPEERLRIGDLLASFPAQRETKAQKLIDGLGTLWKRDASEKVVIFATYLGTVDLIEREIDQAFPGQGVVVSRVVTMVPRWLPNAASSSPPGPE